MKSGIMGSTLQHGGCTQLVTLHEHQIKLNYFPPEIMQNTGKRPKIKFSLRCAIFI
jgi:hypothetical protein